MKESGKGDRKWLKIGIEEMQGWGGGTGEDRQIKEGRQKQNEVKTTEDCKKGERKSR